MGVKLGFGRDYLELHDQQESREQNGLNGYSSQLLTGLGVLQGSFSNSTSDASNFTKKIYQKSI